MAEKSEIRIKDRKSLLIWLSGLTSEDDRYRASSILTCRAALRCLPIDGRGLLSQLTDSAVLEVFRGNITAYGNARSKMKKVMLQTSSPKPFRNVEVAELATKAGMDLSADTECCELAAEVCAAHASSRAKNGITYLNASSEVTEVARRTLSNRKGAAAARLSRVEFWNALAKDAAKMVQYQDFREHLNAPIWSEPPEWFIQSLQSLRSRLTSLAVQHESWKTWFDWYDAVAFGKNPFDLKKTQSLDDLIELIVAGGSDEEDFSDFWFREPSEVNRAIASWVVKAQTDDAAVVRSSKPVFISYSAGDVSQAKRIGDVINMNGYSVFAQYQDMPPGSNFVAEMQSGLASMGKFVPVYSPRYLKSDHCQAEWNAAYNMDPLGKRKLIVGFLLEKTELLPLQKQTVYVPLYGLTESQAKSAILSALRTAGAERTPLQTREAAKKYAVPIPETNAAGQLTFVPLAEVEQPFIDDDIARLPTSMLRVLGHLLDALEGPNNAPQLVKSLLRGLQGELTVNGAMARVPDLQRDIEMLLAERGRALRDGAVWADGGFGTGINQLEVMFSSYRQNFPLVMVREIERRQAAIDPAKFDDAKFKISHDSIAAATEAMGDAGQTDASVAHVVFQRQRQRKDIEILGRYVPQGSDRLVDSSEERTVEELKKDFMFDESGLWDRTLGRVEKVASIADSTGGKALIVAAKEFLKSIWGG